MKTERFIDISLKYITIDKGKPPIASIKKKRGRSALLPKGGP